MSLNVFAVSKLVADLLPNSEAVVLLIFPSKKELGKLLVGGQRVGSLQSHPLTICLYGLLGKMTNNGISWYNCTPNFGDLKKKTIIYRSSTKAGS